jgi:hypothetical protein
MCPCGPRGASPGDGCVGRDGPGRRDPTRTQRGRLGWHRRNHRTGKRCQRQRYRHRRNRWRDGQPQGSGRRNGDHGRGGDAYRRQRHLAVGDRSRDRPAEPGPGSRSQPRRPAGRRSRRGGHRRADDSGDPGPSHRLRRGTGRVAGRRPRHAGVRRAAPRTRHHRRGRSDGRGPRRRRSRYRPDVRTRAVGPRRTARPRRQKVEDGQLGVVTGEGFYVWEDGAPIAGADPDPDVPTRGSESEFR